MAYALHVGIFSCDLAPVLSGLYMFVWTYLYTWLHSRKGKNVEPLKPLISSKNTGAPQISNLAFFRCLDNSSLMQLGQVLLQPGSSYCLPVCCLPWQSEQVLTFLVNNLNHTMQEMPLWNQLKNHAAPCLVRRLCTSAPKNHGTSFQRSALHEDLTSW